MINQLISLLCRLFFVVALALFVIAFCDRILLVFGWKLNILAYQPGRLLEISALLMIFVIAILLRQIRDKMLNK